MVEMTLRTELRGSNGRGAPLATPTQQREHWGLRPQYHVFRPVVPPLSLRLRGKHELTSILPETPGTDLDVFHDIVQ